MQVEPVVVAVLSVIWEVFYSISMARLEVNWWNREFLFARFHALLQVSAFALLAVFITTPTLLQFTALLAYLAVALASGLSQGDLFKNTFSSIVYLVCVQLGIEKPRSNHSRIRFLVLTVFIHGLLLLWQMRIIFQIV